MCLGSDQIRDHGGKYNMGRYSREVTSEQSEGSEEGCTVCWREVSLSCIRE